MADAVDSRKLAAPASAAPAPAEPASAGLNDEVDQDRLVSAYQAAVHDLLAARNSSNHWVGELSTSALSTATAVSAMSIVLRRVAESGDATCLQDCLRDVGESAGSEAGAAQAAWSQLRDRGVEWLLTHQNQDGGWGDTELSKSNISTTMLAKAAIELSGRTESAREMIRRADEYIQQQGGIPGLRRRYGKDKTFAVPILANGAIAGQVPWKEVSPLPFEAAWVPQKFYRWMQLPVVSYAIPALVAIGQARFFHAPPLNPLARLLRKAAVQPTLNVLERMQPASGGYLEAIPLTCFVIMGLASSQREQAPVVRNGLRFVWESVRADGSWPIDTNLATWNTTLSINALSIPLKARPATSAQQMPVSDSACGSDTPRQTECEAMRPARAALQDKALVEWLLQCQHRQRHPFTGADPGGFGWSDLSGAVPDADDTPGALLALRELQRKFTWEPELLRRIEAAAKLGLEWLLGLQNRDGGWPTFCRGWGKLPFDRSGADLTAHALRAIAAWAEPVTAADSAGELSRQLTQARELGLRYLERYQAADGSWLPLWFGNQDHPDETNPVYGTAKVLLALRDLELTETPMAKRGLAWLQLAQNEDGGWGGGSSVEARRTQAAIDWRRIGRAAVGGVVDSLPPMPTSSVEETALAVDAWLGCLTSAEPPSVSERAQDPPAKSIPEGVQRGVEWLVEATEQGWNTEVSPIGFYFAKLWYHERTYPLVFTTAALGAAVRLGTAQEFRLA